jgi:hypothetical protein
MPNENQHWIPKFLIRNFADTDGRVYRLDIQSDKITKPPPKHVASTVDFNEFVIDGEPASFEDRLEKIETRAAPIIKRIVLTRSITGLTSAERTKLADFMAAQSFRTEAFYKGMQLEIPRRDFGSIFADLWRSAVIKSQEISRRNWAFMTIEIDDVFYLGDQPLVLQLTENPASGGELGLDIQGVEAFLPLAPGCALYMPCTTVSRQIIEGYETSLWTHKQLRAAALRGTTLPGINWDSLHQIQRVLGTSHALYESLTNGVAFSANRENIDNFNYPPYPVEAGSAPLI